MKLPPDWVSYLKERIELTHVTNQEIRPSSLRDVATKRLEGDCTRLRAAATAGVQAIDRGDLFGRQFEVEYIDVLSDASRLCGLRNHRPSLLQTPAQHHLRRALAVGPSDRPDDWVVEGAAMTPVAIERDAADR